MKTFLRLSDNRWPITELDLDPACISPSPNFRPNETEYLELPPACDANVLDSPSTTVH